MLIEQISVFVENKLGSLAEVTGLLANASIDIRAFSIADTTDFGILRLIVNDPDKAETTLREAGIAVSKTKVVAVQLTDKPGAMHQVLELLSANGISVEYAYAFITRKSDYAYVILRIENPERAAALFEKNGISALPPAEVYSLS